MDKKKLGVLLCSIGVILITVGFVIKPNQSSETINIITNTITKDKATVTPTVIEQPSIAQQADFKRTILQKFNPKYFKAQEQSNSSEVNVEFSNKGKKYPFSIVCSYYKTYNSNHPILTSSLSIKTGKGKEGASQVAFVIVGTGGTAVKPDNIYILPLGDIDSESISISFLDKYKKKKTEGSFFFDFKKGELR